MAYKSIASFGRKAYLKHEIIVNYAKNKKVIHYGCVDDDEDLIKSKVKSNRYLHKLISDNSKSTVGIDLNHKAFIFLKNELGLDNIVFGNVEEPGTFKMEKEKLKSIDIILIPDLIEHLSNPGRMLDGIKKYYSQNVKIVILTPNPFAWYNFVATLFNKEIYTPYHTMYFTSESMAVLLDRHGFKISRVIPVVTPKDRNSLVRLIDSLISRISVFISPGFADLYLYECTKK